MKTCKSCKWHGKDEYSYHHTDMGGVCKNTNIRECDHHSFDDYKANRLVYSFDESGTFWTGDDFGCVHHEEIKPEPYKRKGEGLKFAEPCKPQPYEVK